MEKRKIEILASPLAMDLGTANTLIYIKGSGIVLNEPSVVAYNEKDEKILAVGAEAKHFLGRTPKNIRAIRPLKNGVIYDFSTTQTMIRIFLKKVTNKNIFGRRKMVVCVPAGVTQIEKKAVVEAVEQIGAGKIYLIEEPMAAAIGAGLDITEKEGKMIIDIGGGTTEVAVISESSVVCNETIRVAGDEFNEAIQHYLLKMKNLQVGENTAEQCKIEAGSAMPDVAFDKNKFRVNGKDIKENKPKEIFVFPDEIRVAMKEPVQAVVDVVKSVLSKTPQEFLKDIEKNGIAMAGGGSLLRGLDLLIEEETGIKCRLTEDPLTTIVMGSGKAVENVKKFKKVFIN